VVVLLSLVYHGDIVLNLGGREALDASNIERAATRAMADLIDFRFYKRPRTLPLNLWVMIFEGLGLPPGQVRDENTRREAVKNLQGVVGDELNRTATLQGQLQQGLQLWNETIFTDRFDYEVESGAVVRANHPDVPLSRTELLPSLRGYKEFLEALSRFNTVGKLRNLRLTVAEVQDALDQQAVVERVAQLLALVNRIQPLTAYLAEAQANLSDDHPWSERAAAMRQALIDDVRRFGGGDADIDPRHFTALSRDLEALKADYVAAYAAQHRRLTLGPQADDRRQRLYDDARLAALNELAAIDLLGGSELETWKHAMTALPTCREFHESAIDDTPTCPFCHLRPAQRQDVRADQALDQLKRRLGDLLTRWRQALRDALTSETARRSLEAMAPDERAPIEQFLAQEDDEAQIPAGFVEAAVRALRGIEALALPVDALLEALKEGGLPCTVEELKRRFAGFVGDRMRGHDARNTRLTLEREA
jgi:hypothetical protein